MNAWERAEVVAAAQHDQIRQYSLTLGNMPICMVFSSHYRLESGFIFTQISTWHISVIFNTIYCIEASSFNVKMWIKLFVARTQKRLFWGHPTKPLTTQHTAHVKSWKNVNCIRYTVGNIATEKYLTKNNWELCEKQYKKWCCKDRSYTVLSYKVAGPLQGTG
jgi:hypothetical protein